MGHVIRCYNKIWDLLLLVLFDNLTATMQELLRDPYTLAFVKRGKVSMPILKQQIDRRIIRIRQLIDGQSFTVAPPKTIPSIDYACQTDCINYCVKVEKDRVKHERVMSVHNSNILIQQDEVPHKQRPSLPSRKRRFHTRQDSGEDEENNNIRTKVTDYLSSKKQSAIFRDADTEKGKNKQKDMIFRRSEQDRQLGNANGGLFGSYKTFESFLDQTSSKLALAMALNGSDEEYSKEFSDDEEPNRRKSFSIARKSTKKNKFTQRTTLPEVESRLLVSEECRKRMKEEVQSSINLKRKQANDNKLKLRIIKTVEQKYGDYFDNL